MQIVISNRVYLALNHLPKNSNTTILITSATCLRQDVQTVHLTFDCQRKSCVLRGTYAEYVPFTGCEDIRNGLDSLPSSRFSRSFHTIRVFRYLRCSSCFTFSLNWWLKLLNTRTTFKLISLDCFDLFSSFNHSFILSLFILFLLSIEFLSGLLDK